MSNFLQYLEVAKNAVRSVADQFQEQDRKLHDSVTAVDFGGKETKIVADTALENKLINALINTGISIFSEESGLIKQGSDASLLWVLDPLDGTVNYLRRVGPSAISLALCNNTKPFFGIVYSLDTYQMSWGGQQFGSWTGTDKLYVSNSSLASQSILCSGFPARLHINNPNQISAYMKLFQQFAKIRMLGSAASSLLMVAQGKVDAYYESEIMFWDIAAGMALVDGAGGKLALVFRDLTSPCQLTATNSKLII